MCASFLTYVPWWIQVEFKVAFIFPPHSPFQRRRTFPIPLDTYIYSICFSFYVNKYKTFLSLFLHPRPVFRSCCCLVSRKFYYPKVIAEEDDICTGNCITMHFCYWFCIWRCFPSTVSNKIINKKRLKILPRTPLPLEPDKVCHLRPKLLSGLFCLISATTICH